MRTQAITRAFSLLIAVLTAVSIAVPARAQSARERELADRLRQVEEKLDKLQKEKDAQVDELQAEIRRLKPVAPPAEPAAATGTTAAPAAPGSSDGALATVHKPPATEAERAPRYFGTYVPGRGFGLVRTDVGEVSFGAYTYLRYLNQKNLDDHYVNGLDQTVKIDQREDIELNKVKLEFRGWLIDPKLRFTLYTWTNNTQQGDGAQVVVAGSLTYRFADPFTLGGGVMTMPSTRSTLGNFPAWLTVDHRTQADEFFKASYTFGVFATGAPLPGVGYFAMLGNNLSQLGVDASQIDADLTTVGVAVWWMPTTGEFGPKSGFGDYEMHEDVATRIGAHFTFSPEDRQSQPGTEDVENSQIRLSNGTIIFTPGALAPGVAVKSVKYYMTDLEAGLKWRGFSLEGEYYLRWLQDFRANGPLPGHAFFDHGFQVLASTMLVPQTLQLYTLGSMIFGEFGDPWEVTTGLNWWPFKRREVRFNLEYLYLHRSAIGYGAIPQVVGATGSVVHLDFELSF